MAIRILVVVAFIGVLPLVLQIYAGFIASVDPLRVGIVHSGVGTMGQDTFMGMDSLGGREISLRAFPTNCRVPAMRVVGPLGYYRSMVYDKYVYGRGVWLPATGRPIALLGVGNGTTIEVELLSAPVFHFVYPDRYRVVRSDIGELYWVRPHEYYVVDSPRTSYRAVVERWVPKPPPNKSLYLEVPDELRSPLMALVSNVTSRASSLEDKLRSLEAFLEENYTYDLSRPPPPPGRDPVEWFLFESRRGICVDFATAFVLMARLLGVQTRLVAGYYVTDRLVMQCDAHAWAEAYIPGKGWVRFDPTPGRGPPPLSTAQMRETLGGAEDQRDASPTSVEPGLPPSTQSLPWLSPYVAVPLIVAVILYMALKPRVLVNKPPGVGDEARVVSRCGSRMVLWGDVSGRGREVAARLSRSGLWVIHARCGPFRYRLKLRVVDYREEIGKLYGKLLRKLYGTYPTAKTPREIAGEVGGTVAELSLLAERVFYGGLRATREIYERFRHV